jgi:hypothetical protein
MRENEAQVIINDFFEFVNKCTESSPDEDKCHQLLDGLLKVAKLITDPIIADNFEAKWEESRKKMKKYADPATLRFYELEINKVLKKILDPARMEL